MNRPISIEPAPGATPASEYLPGEHFPELAITCVMALLACGCATERIPGAQDAGSSVRAAFAAQVAHPDAARTAPSSQTLQGMAAKATIDRYTRSFESPAASGNLFSIGVGTLPSTASPAAAGGGGAGARP